MNCDALRDAARNILRRNDRDGYCVPTSGLYPFQWNWDSAFTALGWATFDEARAWREIERLFEGQWADGMVPHIVFHKQDPSYFPGPEVWGVDHHPPTSGLTQPPVVATAMRLMLANARDVAAAESRARELYPKVLAWHRWFHTARDPDASGLVAAYHPWETGMDNSIAWDGPMARTPIDELPPYERRDTGHVDASERPSKDDYDRYLTLVHRFRAAGYAPGKLFETTPFRVSDVATNALLYRADGDLLAIARRLGIDDGVQDLQSWRDRSRAAFDRLWSDDAGCYAARDQLTGEQADIGTTGGLLPLFAGLPDAARAGRMAATVEAWLDEITFALPSADPRHPKFEPRRYWRGPVWVHVNWMLGAGLRAYGFDALASRLEADSRWLLTEKGFFEYYDPTDGTGCGGGAFTWPAATALFWFTDPLTVKPES